MAETRITITRRDLLAHRFVRHDLHRAPGSLRSVTDVALLDYGVQDTGVDGAPWALAIRGAPAATGGDLGFAWTLRGAPHAYRRADLAAVAVATSPLSEADAAKRIFDAARPLKAAGIPVLDALRTIAEHTRAIVAKPTVKGDLSARLTEELDPPFLRWCRPCQATHTYEQPFRLAALQAGLELEPGTSPPVLRRVPRLAPARFRRTGDEAGPRFDVIRNHLRFYPGARIRDVAAFVDAPVKDITAHWPEDAVEVKVSGAPPAGKADTRFVLAEDVDGLAGPADAGDGAVRLAGPYDPYLQLRDRELLVGDAARRKDLWRVLGRPGAIVDAGEVIGTWRPKASGKKLTVLIDPWTRLARPRRALVDEQAERLAAHRGVTLAAVSTS